MSDWYIIWKLIEEIKKSEPQSRQSVEPDKSPSQRR